jgi:hypothetical protein
MTPGLRQNTRRQRLNPPISTNRCLPAAASDVHCEGRQRLRTPRNSAHLSRISGQVSEPQQALARGLRVFPPPVKRPFARARERLHTLKKLFRFILAVLAGKDSGIAEFIPPISTAL